MADQVEKIADNLSGILEHACKITGLDDGSFNQYQQICTDIPDHIRSGRLKIAVVGVIKSGKSTFVNSFLKKELVKRGAGVVTAITTRIRKGEKNKANLYFKTWDEINLQLHSVLKLFPDESSICDRVDGENLNSDTRSPDIKNLAIQHSDTQPFDIRRQKDRDYLERVYHSMKTDFSVSIQGIRPETILIHHALKGFAACKNLVGADETCLCFESKEFDHHKQFTADPDKAFYVKDVCLDLFGKTMDPHIEIADCQGADSTDPSQLAKVLAYIETSNLIIYCISSRTGLRQADIILLNRIKRLGLLDHIVFINNCDLSEHENIDDLIKIETNILQDLSFLNTQPRIFSFSTLYNLFSSLKSILNSKELARLMLWEKDQKMVRYCDEQTRKFMQVFTQMIDKDRDRLLISNHLNRLDGIVNQMDDRADMVLDLLSSDRLKEKQAIKRLDVIVENASRLETIVYNSLEGAVKGLKEKTASDIQQFFKTDGALILKKAQAFIEGMAIDVEQYKEDVKQTGFKKILYLMFQDFKQQLDFYGLEHISPELKKHTLKKEEQINAYFQSLFHSYQIDLNLSDNERKSDKTFKNSVSLNSIDIVDFQNIKKILGLKLPDFVFEATYSSGLKADIFSGFFFKMFSQIFTRVFQYKSEFSFSPILELTAEKIKKENQKAIKSQFNQFSKILYAGYFLPLIEAAIREFEDKIDQQFNWYRSFKQEKQGLFSLSLSDKENQRQIVLSIKEQMNSIRSDIASING